MIHLPVLLIVGDQDVPCIASMEAIRDAIPHAEYHVIPRCGHASNLEKPEEWNRIFVDFLERHPM